MDWIHDMNWMSNVRQIINMIYPSKARKRVHEYGIVEEASECNILESNKKGSLLIAPFRDRTYKHTVLLINPQTIHIIEKFSATKIWRLWDTYYAVLIDGLPTIKNLAIYIRTAKGMKNLKNVSLTSNFSLSLVQHVLSSKHFKAIYVMEDFRLCMIRLISNEKQEWSCKDKILQGFICEETKTLTLCSNNKILVHSLDNMGRVKNLVYSISLDLEFGAACLEARELSILTFEKRINDIAYTESDEDEELSLHISKFRLEESGYEAVQYGSLLAELPQSNYKFEFVPGNKAIVCISNQKPLVILSVNTGEVLFKHSMIGNVLKVHPKEGAIFISNETALQRLNVDAYIPC